MDKLTKCIVCGHSHFKGFIVEAESKDMRWDCWGYDKMILKCPECGLMFLYPQWTKEELDKLYTNYLDQKDFSWQKQAVRISKYLLKYAKKGQMILEIGCGKGENVKYLTSKGRCMKGIDKDPTYCDNVNVFNMDYKDQIIDCWDFIYAIQVFEHIADPEDFIQHIMELLMKKGRFLLEFPNTEDPILTLYHVKKFKKFYYIPHHLFFWTPSTVQAFFDRLGIKIKIKLLQKYGIINHLRWIIFGVPGNWHPHIPILDDIYKWVLINIFRKSDTIILLGEKNEQDICDCRSGNKPQRGHQYSEAVN
jgi:SAM-dependent methyltransferase